MPERAWWEDWLPTEPPELGPGRPQAAWRERLANLDLAAAFAPQPIRDLPSARCVHAGLWLCRDFLDEAHEICQGIATPDGASWHALVHRREPDPDNAKYWFQRVAGHPALAAVSAATGRPYLPSAFIDDCELRRGTGTPAEAALRRTQLAELRALLAHNAARAKAP